MRLTDDPSLESSAASAGWRARLDLGYRRDGDRTVLATRVHQGPLVVQKSLYPEGGVVCQNVIVHPPGGIVGGDALAVNVDAGEGAHAQLTTPGAAKCYRSAGAFARQRIGLRAARGAIVEWLPQETIVFDAAKIDIELTIDLAGDAVFMGWDVICLGRTAAGERFDRGALRQRMTLTRDGAPVFVERVLMDGGARLLASSVGLRGQPVFGTFLAAAPEVSVAMLEACRKVNVIAGEGGIAGEGAVTRLPGVLIARYRGASAAAARRYFVDLWRVLRPALAQRAALPPRIWAT